MKQVRFNYSLKNIGLPSQDCYRRMLIDKVETVVSRMRWKAHFFLHETNATEQYKFGLKSKNSPPVINEMKSFEEDLIEQMENIKFRKVTDTFLNNLSKDLKKVKSSPNVFLFADKTRNVYATSPENYNKILKENVTKTYMIAQNDVLEDINFELKNLTSDLSIGDRLETMAPKEAFVTVKDHKDNFEVNPTYRLINPAKSELGKISKIVLDDINCQIKNIINVNQ